MTHCIRLLISFQSILISFVAMGDVEKSIDSYNVVWETPSKDSSESMPCGGGDIGMNVWVEERDVLFYMQRGGSLAEQNEYLKLGRVRLQLAPIHLLRRI